MIDFISKFSFEDFIIKKAAGWSFDQNHTFTFQQDKAAAGHDRQKKQTRREVMEQQ